MCGTACRDGRGAALYAAERRVLQRAGYIRGYLESSKRMDTVQGRISSVHGLHMKPAAMLL